MSPDLRDWRKVLTPCPIPIEPTSVYVFFVDSLRDARARIIEVLDRYGMPYAFYPDDKYIVTCRMHFSFEEYRGLKDVTFTLDLDDRVFIDFSSDEDPIYMLDAMSRKAMEIIDFAIEFLRETRLVNSENEDKVRERLVRGWYSAIEVPKSLLLLLRKSMSR